MTGCHCEMVGSRRHEDGENTGPIVIPLGLMLLALCFVALVFHRLKQSNIIACILIGTVVGSSGMGDSVSRELTAAFIELGIILVLFMGGLEVDVQGCTKRWKLVLLNGMGQIIITLAFFCVVGIVTGLTSEVVDTVFFGLAGTLSSTILVLGALKDRQEMEALHGQVILGLCVLQDTTAVVSLLVLSSFDPEKADGPSFGVAIGIMIGKFAATIVILVFLSRYVLSWWFKLFAVSGEMLFVGTVGYALGVAGLAGLADFSPEIGGFFAGVSLSSVPYRLEIEHKVEPIKAFGVVLFFFMLGIDLHVDFDSLKAALPWAALLAVLKVVVLPTVMWALGYLSRFRGRTAFMIGLVINQISEFSLILAQLAHKYEVFNSKQYQIITFATVISLLFSSISHVHADDIYKQVGWILERLDRRTNEEDEAEEEFVMDGHVVLLGFNETGLEIAEFYRHNNQDVLVIQLDPSLHGTFKKGYVKPHLRPVFNPLPPEEAPHPPATSVRGFDWSRTSFDFLEGCAFRPARSTPGEYTLGGVGRTTGPSPVPMSSLGPSPSQERCGSVWQGPMMQMQTRARISLDIARPRYSMEGNGWKSRKSMDGPQWSGDGAGCPSKKSLELSRRSTEDNVFANRPKTRADVLRGRHSFDLTRFQTSSLANTNGSINGNGRRSLDLQRYVPTMVTFPMESVEERHTNDVVSPRIEKASPIVSSKEKPNGMTTTKRTNLLPGKFLPGRGLAEEEGIELKVVNDETKGARVTDSQQSESMPLRTEPDDLAQHEGIEFSTRKNGQTHNKREEMARGQTDSCASQLPGRSMQQSFRDAVRMLPDRGPKEGMATNIFSVYADPESPATWDHYQLGKAKIVVSCMVGGQTSELKLSRTLKKEGVPFLAITNSNCEAKELYDAGCRYVIQQAYLASKVMKEILDDEIPKGQKRAFHDTREEHKGELQDNTEDELVHKIHSFL